MGNTDREEAEPLTSKRWSESTDESEDQESTLKLHKPTSQRKTTLLVLSILILTVTNALSAYLGALVYGRRHNLDAICAAHTSSHSPVLNHVGVKYSQRAFNGTFMHENVYRRKGSSETDEAWVALGVDSRPGVISYEDGLMSGLTEAHVQVADRYGGGFLVNVEGMHHLHCLNLVRKSLYYNIDYYRDLGTHAFVNDEHILQLHVSHCLDIIRQVLMCQVDTGVLGQIWWDKEEPKAFVDFNTRHTCKNFDDVSEYAKKLQAPLPDQLPPDYLKRPKLEYVLESMP